LIFLEPFLQLQLFLSFPAATKNGVWGDPRKSTKRQGEKMLSEIVNNLAKKCQTCLTAKNPNLHQ